jgi:hypothetical protein
MTASREAMSSGPPADLYVRDGCTESKVDLSTHEAFGMRPTTFAEFASRNAPGFLASSGAA